jgi:hypothetical protein
MSDSARLLILTPSVDPDLFSMQFTVPTHDGKHKLSSQQLKSKSSTYTIIVSGERLTFSREQLESEPRNKLAEYFFGTPSQPSTGKLELRLEKEPALFKLIQAHLRGYNIFPIGEGCVPYMTTECVLDNLLKEAEYYALNGLVKRLQDSQGRVTELPKYMLSVSTHLSILQAVMTEWGTPRQVCRGFSQTKAVKPLDDATYNTLFQANVASSSRVIVSSIQTLLGQTGYTISISWVTAAERNLAPAHYALLVRNDM